MSHAEDTAHLVDPIVVDSETLGYVDRDGNIRRVDDHRSVGHIANDRDHAIRVLCQRYQQYVDQTEAWIAETREHENRVWRVSDCERMIREVSQQFVLGDLQAVVSKLSTLKNELEAEQQSRIATRDKMIRDARTLSSSTEWKDAAQQFEALNEQFKAIGSVGDREKDQEQWDAFKEHERAFRTARKAHFEQLEAEFSQRAAAKESICVLAEQLQESSDFREAGAQYRELMEQWKQIGFAGREKDDALWARFNGARDVFNKRRNAWFAENAVRKEALAKQAEQLASMEDAAAAHREMKPLMESWRAIGSAGKDADDKLWARFRGSQEHVFQRSRVIFDARQNEREANYIAKEALVKEAESLLALDSRAATQRAKELQQQWKQIGPVPREKNEAQWQRFRAACDSVFRVASEQGKRRLLDARDKAEEQIRKLSAEIDEHERKIEHWKGVIANLRDGDKAEEIRESMEAKIATAKERIAIKLTWIEEQHARMVSIDQRRK